MKLQIIQIGNSLGIRIPKPLLKQCGFKDSVIVEVKDGDLILSAKKKPRHNWKEQFKKMGQSSDDKLIDIENIKSDFDENEWEW